MAERCTVVSLPVTDLDNAAKDPALASLIAEGWSLLGSVVVVPPGAADPVLKLVLKPPGPAVRTTWLLEPVWKVLAAAVLLLQLLQLWQLWAGI
tara:strand:+ start:185 stop:466 length:282 start_codon:yes stop_codon:yes gene_type:complete